jgi:hypothetical protein
MFLGLKDIFEGLFVPYLEALLEVFDFLMESVHIGAMLNG